MWMAEQRERRGVAYRRVGEREGKGRNGVATIRTYKGFERESASQQKVPRVDIVFPASTYTILSIPGKASRTLPSHPIIRVRGKHMISDSGMVSHLSLTRDDNLQSHNIRTFRNPGCGMSYTQDPGAEASSLNILHRFSLSLRTRTVGARMKGKAPHSPHSLTKMIDGLAPITTQK